MRRAERRPGRPGRDDWARSARQALAGRLLGPIPPPLSAKPDHIFPHSRLLTWKLAAEVSDCAGRCWGGFVKGGEGGASPPVPWRKERLDRLDGMVAGGPTGEQKEQLSLTHRPHTNVQAGAQTKSLHARPQNKAVHCGLRAAPHWRTKAVPQDGHRSGPCTKSSGVSLTFQAPFWPPPPPLSVVLSVPPVPGPSGFASSLSSNGRTAAGSCRTR